MRTVAITVNVCILSDQTASSDRALSGHCGSYRAELVGGHEDWLDADPDEFLRDRCHEAPFLPHATYHYVATTVTPPLLGMLAGDHLVRVKSAAGLGKSRRLLFAAEQGLSSTPLVYAKLSDWLSQSATRPAGIGDVGRDVSGDP
jgi:hypothetical protein